MTTRAQRWISFSCAASAVVIRAILGENVVRKNVHIGSSDLNKEIAVGNDVVVERGEH